MEQSAELAVVQIVPVAAVDDLAIEAGEAGDRAVHVGPAEDVVLVRVLGWLPGRVQRVEAWARGDPERLVARDHREPGLRPLGRLAAVAPAPRPHDGLLCRVLGRARDPANALRLPQAVGADDAPIPVGHGSPRLSAVTN